MFTDADIIALCDELGIEVSHTGGYPTLRGVELTPELTTKILTSPSEYSDILSDVSDYEKC